MSTKSSFIPNKNTNIMKKIILASFIFLVVLAIFTPIPALTDLDVTEAVTNEPPVEPT